MDIKKYESLYDMLEVFPTEKSCIEHLEHLRWPRGIICQWCGLSGKFYHIKRRSTYKCCECKREFSVRKNTVFEESPIALRKWFVAAWLMASHRKGLPSTQLAREIHVTQKTAWFMLSRLRAVMGMLNDGNEPMDGEVDETYFGGKEKNKHADKKLRAGRGPVGKQPVAGIRARDGRVTAVPVACVKRSVLHGFIQSNVVLGARVYTDEALVYHGLRGYRHKSVKHRSGEYVRGNIHTNGIESFWALLKRGYVGVFHHFSWKHVRRYLHEFCSRWNMMPLGGAQRLNVILESSVGVRLTYEELIQ